MTVEHHRCTDTTYLYSFYAREPILSGRPPAPHLRPERLRHEVSESLVMEEHRDAAPFTRGDERRPERWQFRRHAAQDAVWFGEGLRQEQSAAAR